MTYLLDTAAQDGPQVHALVIGVGTYRHLRGGSDPVPYDTMVTRQLTSPPLSALAFARWVIDELRHPVAGPGSVDVLLSPGEVLDPDGRSHEVEVPSADAVQRAVDRWVSRCNSHSSNVALFYFSGHGLDNGSPLLLLEDFARSRNRILDAAVNLQSLVQGMRTCGAGYQYYFLDSCRERTARLSSLRETHTLPLLDIQDGPERRSDLTVMPAALSGGSAYADQHRVSDYTRALLDALAGRAASTRDGRWRVTSLDLYEAVYTLTRTAPPVQVPGLNVHGNSVLHVLDGPPQVPLGVRCDPDAAARLADVSLSALGGAGDKRPVLELDDPVWRTVASAGVYAVGVDFPDGHYTAPFPAGVHAFFPPDLEFTVAVERVR
ncbi:caspase family protein [Streptomyces sp. CA-210063]|uniref:caspase family protein n=1 Tax=Streptomyces sp. CA-210063 TaxID=2801029 RepID=UPI00214B79C8|nr:caspase family protein [Streptomyces sp. CA-210063]UUU28520.1 caspase family protein [Streptomyces sp. CA-210063]